MLLTTTVKPAHRAVEKLRHLLGDEAADELVASTMRRVGLKSLADPDDLAKFAEELILTGGLVEAVGRAIKIQALLAGAKPLAATGTDRG